MVDEWVRAGRAGDETAETEAGRMLVGARHWPSITALDPEQWNGTLTMDDVRDPWDVRIVGATFVIVPHDDGGGWPCAPIARA